MKRKKCSTIAQKSNIIYIFLIRLLENAIFKEDFDVNPQSFPSVILITGNYIYIYIYIYENIECIVTKQNKIHYQFTIDTLLAIYWRTIGALSAHYQRAIGTRLAHHQLTIDALWVRYRRKIGTSVHIRRTYGCNIGAL